MHSYLCRADFSRARKYMEYVETFITIFYIKSLRQIAGVTIICFIQPLHSYVPLKDNYNASPFLKSAQESFIARDLGMNRRQGTHAGDLFFCIFVYVFGV